MDLDKVREFLAFYDYLNFTATAKALNLTQSTLSKHISDMEEELGVKLIERGGSQRGNTLTPAGKVFLEGGQALITQYEQIAQRCRAAGQSYPSARVQAVQFDVDLGPQIRRAIAASAASDDEAAFTYERILIDARDALDARDIDLVIHYEPIGEMVAFATPELREQYGWVTLHAEPLCLMCDARHPLAGKEHVPISEAALYPVCNLRSSAYHSWYTTLRAVFHKRGWELDLNLLPEGISRDDGGFRLERTALCPCTERFFRYNQDLGLQNLTTVQIEGFENGTALVYPFLVYRLDNHNPHVKAIVEGFASVTDARSPRQS